MEKSCKEHPYHNQKQGVCPSCLRERLSKIYAVVTTSAPPVDDVNTALSSSSSMSCSSVSSSRIMSHRHHQRTASDVMGGGGSISLKVSSILGSNNYGLKKSRSVAFVPRNLVGDVKHGKNKKKKGFWSKLLHLKGKNNEVNFDGKIALKGFA